MQNKTALTILILAMLSLTFNFGCKGAVPTESTFGSIAVPTTGKCGSLNVSGDVTVVSPNTCYTGALEDIADSATDSLWNCKGSAGGKTAACTLPLPPASVLPGSSNGILTDADYFYIGINSAKGVIGHVHATSGFSDACGISKDTTSNVDLSCIIDMPEGDIYAKDLEIIYNIPPGNMCRYLVRSPQWFYNVETGIGPEKIIVNVTNATNASGDLTNVSTTCKFDTGAVLASCSGDPEIRVEYTPTARKFSCIYDHTGEDGPNCCIGNYEVTTNVVTNGGPTVTTIAKSDWGGSYKNCIGGGGRSNWTVSKKIGLPAALVQFTEATGIKATQTVTAPTNFPSPLNTLTSSIHTAGYYGGYANHTHTGFVDLVTTSTMPFFYAPIDDRSGTPMYTGQPSWDFYCYDAGFEIKHRIRVTVKDWDTLPDFQAYIDSKGAVSAPDRGEDLEPSTNCDGLSLGSACNDSYDADDFLKLNLVNNGVLATPTYVMAPLSIRKEYFPAIRYGGN